MSSPPAKSAASAARFARESVPQEPPVTATEGPAKEKAPDNGTPAVRVREYFPETLLWRPEIITDDNGQANLDIDLADSITTWRLTASAVAADGRLGAAQAAIRVFQPFFVDVNLPVTLTRGDEAAVPVVVYNYLDRPQTVALTLSAGDWFKRSTMRPRKSISLRARFVPSPIACVSSPSAFMICRSAPRWRSGGRRQADHRSGARRPTRRAGGQRQSETARRPST